MRTFLRTECEMVQVQMTEIERNRAIVTTFALNEQGRELGHEVGKFRDAGGELGIGDDLAQIVDSLNYELRDRILTLVSHNLGPHQQANLMTVLHSTGHWLDEERK